MRGWIAYPVALLIALCCRSDAAGWSNTALLHEFGGGGADGSYALGNVEVNGSVVYGMTVQGGDYNRGTVFSVHEGSGAFALLHEFFGGISDGAQPYGSLTRLGSTFYGTTFGGGNFNHGTVFSMQTNGGGFTLLHEFLGGLGDGAAPTGNLTPGGSTLYGTTTTGGLYDAGTIFAVGTNGSNHRLLHHFAGGTSDGGTPRGSLLLDGSTLYGMTSEGGANGGGTVFAVSTGGGGYRLLHEFAGGPDDGAEPIYGALALSGSNLYGMTSGGGDYGLGTIFSIATDGSDFTLMHEFTGGADDGAVPKGGLLLDRATSTFYGLTEHGGDDDFGTLFSIEMDGSNFTLMHDFAGGPDDGAYPAGDVRLSNDRLYGMTRAGGDFDRGTVFSAPTPEPTTLGLLLVAALTAIGYARLRRR